MTRHRFVTTELSARQEERSPSSAGGTPLVSIVLYSHSVTKPGYVIVVLKVWQHDVRGTETPLTSTYPPAGRFGSDLSPASHSQKVEFSSSKINLKSKDRLDYNALPNS